MRLSLPSSSWSKAARTAISSLSPAVEQGGQAGVHGGEVVQPRRGEELPLGPEHRRRRRVEGEEVEAVDVGRARPRPGAATWSRTPGPGVPDAPDRRGVVLPVQLEPVLADRAVEVDGQLRDPDDGTGAHERRAAVAQHQPAGEPELAVEPGVEQRPAVDLPAQLVPPVRGQVRRRLEPERRGVGVRADDPERRQRARRRRARARPRARRRGPGSGRRARRPRPRSRPARRSRPPPAAARPRRPRGTRSARPGRTRPGRPRGRRRGLRGRARAHGRRTPSA